MYMYVCRYVGVVGVHVCLYMYVWVGVWVCMHRRVHVCVRVGVYTHKTTSTSTSFDVTRSALASYSITTSTVLCLASLGI